MASHKHTEFFTQYPDASIAQVTTYLKTDCQRFFGAVKWALNALEGEAGCYRDLCRLHEYLVACYDPGLGVTPKIKALLRAYDQQVMLLKAQYGLKDTQPLTEQMKICKEWSECLHRQNRPINNALLLQSFTTMHASLGATRLVGSDVQLLSAVVMQMSHIFSVSLNQEDQFDILSPLLNIMESFISTLSELNSAENTQVIALYRYLFHHWHFMRLLMHENAEKTDIIEHLDQLIALYTEHRWEQYYSLHVSNMMHAFVKTAMFVRLDIEEEQTTHWDMYPYIVYTGRWKMVKDLQGVNQQIDIVIKLLSHAVKHERRDCILSIAGLLRDLAPLAGALEYSFSAAVLHLQLSWRQYCNTKAVTEIHENEHSDQFEINAFDRQCYLDAKQAMQCGMALLGCTEDLANVKPLFVELYELFQSLALHYNIRVGGCRNNMDMRKEALEMEVFCYQSLVLLSRYMRLLDVDLFQVVKPNQSNQGTTLVEEYNMDAACAYFTQQLTSKQRKSQNDRSEASKTKKSKPTSFDSQLCRIKAAISSISTEVAAEYNRDAYSEVEEAFRVLTNNKKADLTDCNNFIAQYKGMVSAAGAKAYLLVGVRMMGCIYHRCNSLASMGSKREKQNQLVQTILNNMQELLSVFVIADELLLDLNRRYESHSNIIAYRDNLQQLHGLVMHLIEHCYDKIQSLDRTIETSSSTSPVSMYENSPTKEVLARGALLTVVGASFVELDRRLLYLAIIPTLHQLLPQTSSSVRSDSVTDNCDVSDLTAHFMRVGQLALVRKLYDQPMPGESERVAVAVVEDADRTEASIFQPFNLQLSQLDITEDPAESVRILNEVREAVIAELDKNIHNISWAILDQYDEYIACWATLLTALQQSIIDGQICIALCQNHELFLQKMNKIISELAIGDTRDALISVITSHIVSTLKMRIDLVLEMPDYETHVDEVISSLEEGLLLFNHIKGFTVISIEMQFCFNLENACRYKLRNLESKGELTPELKVFYTTKISMAQMHAQNLNSHSKDFTYVMTANNLVSKGISAVLTGNKALAKKTFGEVLTLVKEREKTPQDPTDAITSMQGHFLSNCYLAAVYAEEEFDAMQSMQATSCHDAFSFSNRIDSIDTAYSAALNAMELCKAHFEQLPFLSFKRHYHVLNQVVNGLAFQLIAQADFPYIDIERRKECLINAKCCLELSQYLMEVCISNGEDIVPVLRMVNMQYYPINITINFLPAVQAIAFCNQAQAYIDDLLLNIQHEENRQRIIANVEAVRMQEAQSEANRIFDEIMAIEEAVETVVKPVVKAVTVPTTVSIPPNDGVRSESEGDDDYEQNHSLRHEFEDLDIKHHSPNSTTILEAFIKKHGGTVDPTMVTAHTVLALRYAMDTQIHMRNFVATAHQHSMVANEQRTNALERLINLNRQCITHAIQARIIVGELYEVEGVVSTSADAQAKLNVIDHLVDWAQKQGKKDTQTIDHFTAGEKAICVRKTQQKKSLLQSNVRDSQHRNSHLSESPAATHRKTIEKLSKSLADLHDAFAFVTENPVQAMMLVDPNYSAAHSLVVRGRETSWQSHVTTVDQEKAVNLRA